LKRKLITVSDSDFDAEEEVPNVVSSPKMKTPKRKQAACDSDHDVVDNVSSIVTTGKKKI
jgi:hypothetical protein